MSTRLAVFQLIGTDAETLLQNQLTCDVRDISSSQARFTAICDLKGRTLCTMLIYRINECDFEIVLPYSMAALLEQHLDKYLRFSRSSLSATDKQVCHQSAPESSPYAVRTIENTTQIAHPSGDVAWCICGTPRSPLDAQTALEADISAGIAWIEPAQSALFLPQVLGLERHGGVSYTKGCYLGQEVIARVHYLGKPKQQLVTLRSEDELNATITTVTSSDDKVVGTVLSRSHKTALSVLSTKADTLVYLDTTPVCWTRVQTPDEQPL